MQEAEEAADRRLGDVRRHLPGRHAQLAPQVPVGSLAGSTAMRRSGAIGRRIARSPNAQAGARADQDDQRSVSLDRSNVLIYRGRGGAGDRRFMVTMIRRTRGLIGFIQYFIERARAALVATNSARCRTRADLDRRAPFQRNARTASRRRSVAADRVARRRRSPAQSPVSLWNRRGLVLRALGIGRSSSARPAVAIVRRAAGGPSDPCCRVVG
jgi:hypothetical protein